MPFEPTTVAAGEAISEAAFNDNFQAIAEQLGDLDNEDLAEDAGITSDKLADRYAVSFCDVQLVGDPGSGGVLLSSGVGFVPPDVDTPGATTRVKRIYPEFPTGRRCYLVAASAYLDVVVAGTGGFAKLWIYQNSTLLGGDGQELDAAGPHYLRNGTPHNNPYTALQSGDYLEFHVGRSATGGGTPPEIRNLSVMLTFKIEMEP